MQKRLQNFLVMPFVFVGLVSSAFGVDDLDVAKLARDVAINRAGIREVLSTQKWPLEFSANGLRFCLLEPHPVTLSALELESRAFVSTQIDRSGQVDDCLAKQQDYGLVRLRAHLQKDMTGRYGLAAMSATGAEDASGEPLNRPELDQINTALTGVILSLDPVAGDDWPPQR